MEVEVDLQINIKIQVSATSLATMSPNNKVTDRIITLKIPAMIKNKTQWAKTSNSVRTLPTHQFIVRISIPIKVVIPTQFIPTQVSSQWTLSRTPRTTFSESMANWTLQSLCRMASWTSREDQMAKLYQLRRWDQSPRNSREL